MHSLIKSPNGDMASQVAAIQALDARIAEWWENVPHRLKLSSEVIEITDKESLPKLLLITVVYHQSLCALHASIVPLFSWSSNDGGDKWGFSRRLSAQVAFDHACAASALFALFSESHDPSTASSFVAYAAYCSCAIQIPFLWSSDLQLRERVRFNIRTNVGNIRTMAKYWRFGAMLVSAVTCAALTRRSIC